MDLWEEVAEPVELLLLECRSAMLEHRDEDYPKEAVGILTSDGVTWPLINQARSPKRFAVSQRLVEEAIAELGRHDQHPVAVYHSHPTSSSGASERDVMMMQENPGSLHVIVGQDGIASWMWWDSLRSVVRIPLPEKVSHGEPT